MKRHFLSSVIAAFALLLILSGANKVFGQSEVSAEEYAVYSAVIDNRYEVMKRGAVFRIENAQLIIRDHTTPNGLDGYSTGKDWKMIKEQFPAIRQEMIDDFANVNKQRYVLKDAFHIEVSHFLIKPEELYRILKLKEDARMNGDEIGWDEFRKLYPKSGGFTELSRVGFNSSSNQAFVYVERWCGFLCGTGEYFLLEKSGDKWRVAKEYMAWIS